ncbi:hypothetical protein MLD38_037511 [Melastoma candidum]|uniref:Uncharacterized protein n=1 Tax=Melastoma candidum TaxID=119954 RepID=A0ACB9LNA1_9MYRT|nr:hypothetical protein MLD38_037511 [Melastoma candidum]
MVSAASEVAISRLIGKSLEITSHKDVLPPKLQARLGEAHRILEEMLAICSVPGNRADLGAREALICASELERTMDIFLVKASTAPRSRRGCLASLFRGVVHLVKLWVRAREKRAKAQIYIAKVGELSRHFPHMQGVKFAGSSKGSSCSKHPKLLDVHSEESVIVGREDAADRLKACLTDTELLRVISVVGDKGIGKTALVRSMYNRPDIERDFECRAWIGNYNSPILESVLVEILKQSPVTTLKDLELKETNRLCEIFHETLMEQRYLIVLDDLKSTEILDNLLYSLPDSRNGSRVIVTCRERVHVPLQLKPWVYLLQVEHLDAKNSRKLLLGHLDAEISRKLLSKRSSINDEELIDKILGKCNGSPQEILLFGGLSAAFEHGDPDSSPMAWLRNLEEDWWNQDVRSLSYGSLPSWVKPCFLYLCLFPKECEISTRRIFQLWLAEGLVHWDGDFTAEACFGELENRNLVQVVRRREMDGGSKTCRVSGHLHDYFSELAIRFGQNYDHQTDNREVLWPSRPTMVLPWLARYSSNNTSLPPQDAKTASRIRSYVSFNTRKSGIQLREVEQLLKLPAENQDRMLLRVLDLEGVYKPKLPKQFGYLLPNLRYLGLRWTILDSLPESVSKLSRLETLDLKHTNVTGLPSSILGLKYLRHLYLNEGSFDKCNPTECCLGSIQTLWGLSIGAKSSFLTVLGKLTGLKKLGLTCYEPVIQEVMKNISTMTKLESLQLRSRDLLGQPSYLKLRKEMKNMQSISKLYLLGWLDEESLSHLPKNLRVLTLSLSEMKFDPMKYLRELSDLVALRLFGNSYTGEYMVCKKGAFLSLQVLKLWKLENLKTLCINEGTMSTLQELDMRDCTKVRKITGIKKMSELKKIKLTRVNEDFAKRVKSNPPSSATIVTCRELAVSSPEDKKEADNDEQEYEDDEEEEEEEETAGDGVNEPFDSNEDAYDDGTPEDD